jgi:hypothetical protein
MRMTYFYLVIWAHTSGLPNSPARDNGHQRLARVQRLWDALRAARRDLAKYEAIAERLRREADVFRQMSDPRDPKP